jgi:hypothetical protein
MYYEEYDTPCVPKTWTIADDLGTIQTDLEVILLLHVDFANYFVLKIIILIFRTNRIHFLGQNGNFDTKRDGIS